MLSLNFKRTVAQYNSFFLQPAQTAIRVNNPIELFTKTSANVTFSPTALKVQTLSTPQLDNLSFSVSQN